MLQGLYHLLRPRALYIHSLPILIQIIHPSLLHSLLLTIPHLLLIPQLHHLNQLLSLLYSLLLHQPLETQCYPPHLSQSMCYQPILPTLHILIVIYIQQVGSLLTVLNDLVPGIRDWGVTNLSLCVVLIALEH